MSSTSSALFWYQEKIESILNITVDRASKNLNDSIAEALFSADLGDDTEARQRCELTQIRLSQRMSRFQELWRKNMQTLLQSDHRAKNDDNNNPHQKNSVSNKKSASSLGMMSKISDEESVFEWTKKDPQLKILMDRVQSNLRSSKILQSVSALQHQETNTKKKNNSIQNTTKQEIRSFPPDLFVSAIHQVEQAKCNLKSFVHKKTDGNATTRFRRQRKLDIDLPLDQWMSIEAKKIESGQFEVANDGTLASLLRFDADDDDDDDNVDLDSYIADHVEAFDFDGIGKVDDWLREFHRKHFVRNDLFGDESSNNEKKNKKKRSKTNDDAAENQRNEVPTKRLQILHLNGIAWGPGHTKGILEDSVRYSLSGRDAPVFSAGHCFVKFPGESSSTTSDLLEAKSSHQEIFARFDLLLPYLNQTNERQKN